MSWQPPANDGGAPITGYQLERQSGFSPRWAPVNKDLIEGTTYDLSDLVEDNTYIFRVKAVNKAGPSNPSEPSETYKAKNPWSKCFIVIQKRLSLNDNVSFGRKRQFDSQK